MGDKAFMTSSDDIDISRLQRIERAWRLAAAESNGLLQQLLEANQRLSHLQGNVAAAQDPEWQLSGFAIHCHNEPLHSDHVEGGGVARLRSRQPTAPGATGIEQC